MLSIGARKGTRQSNGRGRLIIYRDGRKCHNVTAPGCCCSRCRAAALLLLLLLLHFISVGGCSPPTRYVVSSSVSQSSRSSRAWLIPLGVPSVPP